MIGCNCLPFMSCCHISVNVPAGYCMGWMPGCICCKDGCKGIPIFCLAQLFQLVCCAANEEKDPKKNRGTKGAFNGSPRVTPAMDLASGDVVSAATTAAEMAMDDDTEA